MKPFWKSKTVWANVVAGALVVSKHYGFDVPALSVEHLAAINIVLRFFTKVPVGVK